MACDPEVLGDFAFAFGAAFFFLPPPARFLALGRPLLFFFFPAFFFPPFFLPAFFLAARFFAMLEDTPF